MASLSRRAMLVGMGALAGLAAASSTSAFAEPADGGLDLGALEDRYDAFVGLWAVDLGTGREVANRADDPFAMCSTFKAYASGRVLQKDQAGNRYKPHQQTPLPFCLHVRRSFSAWRYPLR